MKHNVAISAYSLILSALSIAVLLGVMVYNIREGWPWQTIVLAILIFALIAGTLFYMPLSVSVDGKNLKVRRCLKSTVIPLSDIESVRLCRPTMGERRICGSGGWFGYWGWFRERDLGKYFAYYGKASDCFFVRLKNGRQYMLGCTDPQPMVDYIENRIRQ